MRRGELAGLAWQHVHLDSARIDVMRSYDKAPKSGKARHLPLHPALVVILRQWKERCPATKEALVFPTNGHMWSEFDTRGLADIMAAAGVKVPAMPWHCCRHTFASHFMMAGGNILTLQKLLGHSTLTMTLIYAHLSPDHMAAEVARMVFPKGEATVTDINEARRQREMGTQRETDAIKEDEAAH
jgi:integrase